MKNINVMKFGISFFIVLVLLSSTYILCPIGFETNDDTGMLMFVTGARTGTPTEATIFANVMWGWFLSTLYRFNENIPWYIITYILLLGTVLAIICRCCIEIFDQDDVEMEADCKRRFLSVSPWGVGVFVALYLSLFCYSSVLFQFTTMSAFCGLGAILLMKLYPAGNLRAYIGVLVLLFFADTIRPKVGAMATMAFLFTFVSLWMVSRKFPQMIYPSLAFFVQITVYFINYIYEKINGWEAFRRYHLARALWKDYPHPSFAQAAEQYAQVGWTEQLYNCANRWFFMDTHINSKAFETINAARNLDFSVSSTLRHLVDAVIKIYTSINLFKIFLLCLIIGFMVYAVYFMWKNKRKICLILCLSLLLPFSILLYFGFNGRVVYRVTFSVFILFLLPMFFLLTDYCQAYIYSGQRKVKYITAAFLLGLSLISVVTPQGMANITRSTANNSQRLESIQLKRRVEKYAVDHPDNIYIYDISLALWGSPFQVYPGSNKPYNLTFWGGSGMYSPPYYEQLRANGLEELYSDQFFAENIYFLGLEEPQRQLVEYMKREYPGSRVEVVDEQQKFVVYKFYRS